MSLNSKIALASACIVGLGIGVYSFMHSGSSSSSSLSSSKTKTDAEVAEANELKAGEVLFFAMSGEPLLPGAFPTLAVSPQKLQSILSLPDFAKHPVVAAFKLTNELRSVQSNDKSFENIMLIGTLAVVKNFNRQNSTITVFGTTRVRLLSIRLAPNGQTYAKVEEITDKLDLKDAEILENHQVIRDCMKQIAAVSMDRSLTEEINGLLFRDDEMGLSPIHLTDTAANITALQLPYTEVRFPYMLDVLTSIDLKARQKACLALLLGELRVQNMIAMKNASAKF